MRCSSFALGLFCALTIAVTVTGRSAAQCTIDFEALCPNAGAVCGAQFGGGLGCVVAGLPLCYNTGLHSYRVDALNPLTIKLNPPIINIDVYFAHTGAATGKMVFYDACDNQVGFVFNTNGDCSAFMPPTQAQAFPIPVWRIEVTVSGPGDAWIDTMKLLPIAGPPCAVNCPRQDADGLVGLRNRSPDMNSDTIVNLLDLTAFAAAFPPNPYSTCADFDCDGVISLIDLTIMANHFNHMGPQRGICNP